MADYVKSKYIEFYTYDYFKRLSDEEYSDEKFEEIYRNHPGRMTPEQVQAHGYDIAKNRLHSQYLDTKFNSKYENELAASTQIIAQMTNAVHKMFPDLQIKVVNGEVKKYGDCKLRMTYMVVGDYDKDNCLTITPSLNDKDNGYFHLNYCTPYWHNGDVYISDVEVMNEIDKYYKFIKDGILPTSFVNKVHHQYENQYVVYFGKNQISLYDVKMVQLYNTLAKEMNKHFGTQYKYSQKMIDKLYKQNECGNIGYVGGFELQYVRESNAELHEFYFYEDDKTHKPDFKCWATYGDWKKEELCELLNTLQPYIMSNYFAETSRKAMQNRYDYYDKVGIGYRRTPDYFDVLMWEE